MTMLQFFQQFGLLLVTFFQNITQFFNTISSAFESILYYPNILASLVHAIPNEVQSVFFGIFAVGALASLILIVIKQW